MFGPYGGVLLEVFLSKNEKLDAKNIAQIKETKAIYFGTLWRGPHGEKQKQFEQKKKIFWDSWLDSSHPQDLFFCFCSSCLGFSQWDHLQRVSTCIFIVFSRFSPWGHPQRVSRHCFSFLFSRHIYIYIYIYLYIIFNLVVPKTSGKLVVFLVSCSSAAFSTSLGRRVSCVSPWVVGHRHSYCTWLLRSPIFLRFCYSQVGLFVSHGHPRWQEHFGVRGSPKKCCIGRSDCKILNKLQCCFHEASLNIKEKMLSDIVWLWNLTVNDLPLHLHQQTDSFRIKFCPGLTTMQRWMWTEWCRSGGPSTRASYIPEKRLHHIMSLQHANKKLVSTRALTPQ